MSDELSDPVLGALHPDEDKDGVGRVWFTPKHEIEVAVLGLFASSRDAAFESMRQAAITYQNIRRLEWEYRHLAAADLAETIERYSWDVKGGPRNQEDLVGQLRLVAVYLDRDGSARMIYRGPVWFSGSELWCYVDADGSCSGVNFKAPLLDL